VDLQGTKTSIHSNKKYGIHARENAKVNIHLPSQHNTSHDNLVENQNRKQELGGSIADINVYINVDTSTLMGHSHMM
jgi:hypothetical protein